DRVSNRWSNEFVRGRVIRRNLAFGVTNDKGPHASLGHPEICCVECTYWEHVVACFGDDFAKRLPALRVFLRQKTTDVFHDEVARAKLANEPCEGQNQFVTRILFRSHATGGKTLARRTADKEVDFLLLFYS